MATQPTLKWRENLFARAMDSAYCTASLSDGGDCTPEALVALMTSPKGREVRREQWPPNHNDGAGLSASQLAVFRALRKAYQEPEATVLGVRLRVMLLCAAWGFNSADFMDKRCASRWA